MAGIPGAGKSTLSNELMASEEHIVCLAADKLRAEFYGAEEIQGDREYVYQMMIERMRKNLLAGISVIYDACSTSYQERKLVLDHVEDIDCEKICYIVATPYEMCIQRNSNRYRFVPPFVLKDKYKIWETPYYHEGWDQIHIRYADGTKGSFGSPEAFVEKHMDFQQDNPHHMETLGEHLLDAKRYLMEHKICEEDSNLAVAALVHDCGKPFAKTYVDEDGQPMDHARYFHHQNYSAFDALFFDYGDKTEEDILEISIIAGLHMTPFTWETEEEKESFKAFVGDSLFEKIMHINQADIFACHMETPYT